MKTSQSILFVTVLVLICTSCRMAETSEKDLAMTVSIGGPDADYRTLKEALQTAPENITHFVVNSGVYTESGLVITRNATILGTGTGTTVIQGAAEQGIASDRVLTIEADAEVTIRDLTIRNGVTREILRRGGGILNFGTLRMESCQLLNNAAVYGAGLDNRGRAIISRSVISGNYTLPMNIEERTTAVGCLGSGGGIKNEPGGILTMEDCELSGNTTLRRGGGLFISCESRAVLIGCVIRDNQSDREGGGICVRGDLTLIDNRIVGNAAGARGGGLSNMGFLDFSGNVIRGNSRNDFDMWSGNSGIYGGGIIGIDEKNRIQTF